MTRTVISIYKRDLILRLDEWILEQRLQEYAPRTLTQYRANVQKFIDWVPDDQEITKDLMLKYKLYLGEVAGSSNTINAWIVSINKYMKWIGRPDLTIKKIKLQSKQSNEEVLSISDF